jgi:hypothetical protein
VRFQHNRDSSFPLLGKHAGALCHQCHRLERGPFPDGSGVAVRYKPLPSLCLSCHDNVHDENWWRTSTPLLESDCTGCHSVETFRDHTFDHARTSFPLLGAHARMDCAGCHDYAVYEQKRYLLFHETATDCIDCHRSPHLRGTDRCADCHTLTTWTVGK